MNHKIAKIIANAMGWRLDFNGFTTGKQTMIIPVRVNKPQPPPEEEKERNERDLFNEIEGNRADVHLAPISEEKPGATGQTNTEDKPEFKPPENYPLRQPQGYPEVLLVSYSDIKQLVETKIGFKCDESFMEDQGIEKIKMGIRNWQDKKRPFYKYVLVDLDDVTIIIERFGRKIKQLMNEVKLKHADTRFYAFSSTNSEKIQTHCQKGGFVFYLKPSKTQVLDVLRHMADEENEAERKAEEAKAAALAAEEAKKAAANEATPGEEKKEEEKKEGDEEGEGRDSALKKGFKSNKENKAAATKGASQEVTLEQLRKEMMNALNN